MKIFYDPKVGWKAFEAPEKPRTPFLEEDTGRSSRFEAYEKAYASAKENALIVGNPSIINVESMHELMLEDNVEYWWRGTAVIRDGKYYLSI